MTGTLEDTSAYPKERPMQSPRIFILTLGALALGASTGPVPETTAGPVVPPAQSTPDR
jgi:hypothetical protein